MPGGFIIFEKIVAVEEEESADSRVLGFKTLYENTTEFPAQTFTLAPNYRAIWNWGYIKTLHIYEDMMRGDYRS